jgi:hypothetical protein
MPGDNTGLLERLTVDATDVGVGAVLLQEGKDDIDLPNCYFFLKCDKDEKSNPQLRNKMTCLIVIFEEF